MQAPRICIPGRQHLCIVKRILHEFSIRPMFALCDLNLFEWLALLRSQLCVQALVLKDPVRFLVPCLLQNLASLYEFAQDRMI